MDWQDVPRFNTGLMDISLPIRPGMFPIGDESNVRLGQIQGYDSPNRLYETQLRMSCHAGTHIDYPAHLNPNGYRAFTENGFRDAFFPRHYFTLAYFLPFDNKRATGVLPSGEWRWGDEITLEEVQERLNQIDQRQPHVQRVDVQGALFRTGWNDHWFDSDFWRRGGPTLSDGAARYLMERGLHYLASDFTFTFEPGRTHDIVLNHVDGNRFLVESLCALSQVHGDLVALLVAPLKLQGCEGLPARVFAAQMGQAETD
jgi:kynurenine formamidase